MSLGFRAAAATLAISVAFFASSPTFAGDDGAAPLWVGIGSIFGGLGLNWGKEDKAPIEYREHGKIVVPPKMELPPPAASSPSQAAAWPINQELQRKKVEKDAAKKTIAGQGDARLRYTHPFDPNSTVTIRASDQEGPAANCPNGKCESSSVLGNLNPMGWVGLGKSAPLGPEPDREWLTDPPKGYRTPVVGSGQASN
jgi:hypothetical protein